MDWGTRCSWPRNFRFTTLRNAGHPINAERQRVRGPAGDVPPVSNTYVGGIASDHPGGAFVLMGGGEVQFRSPSIDEVVLRQMANRADRAIPEEWKTEQPVAEPAKQ